MHVSEVKKKKVMLIDLQTHKPKFMPHIVLHVNKFKVVKRIDSVNRVTSDYTFAITAKVGLLTSVEILCL